MPAIKLMKSLIGWSWTVLTAIALLGCFDTAKAQTNALVVSPTSLTFTSPTGLSPAPQTLAIGTSTASSTFSITPFGESCSMIQVSPSSGTTAPGGSVIVQVVAQAASAAPGTYACTLNVSAPSLSTVPVLVTVNVTGGGNTSGTLTVAPTTLALTAQSGTTPVTSALTLTNSVPSTPVNYTATASSTPAGWLQISPTSGTVPPGSSIQVQANPTNLTAGTYQGAVVITPTGGAALTVPVSLTVAGIPSLQVQQGGQTVSSVTFYHQIGTTLPSPQTLAVSSSNSAVNLPFTLDLISGSNFLVVTPTGSLNTPQNVTVSVASTVQLGTLIPGNYVGSIRFSAPTAANPTTTIPANLVVSNNPLLTQVGSAPSTFTYQGGGSVPANQTVQIGTTSTALPLNIATTLSSGQNWLIASLSATSASAASPATLTIGVNPTGLAGGTYNASITVSSPGVANTIVLPVTLTVSTSNLLAETPSQLAFTWQTNTFLPAPQVINITSSGGAIPFNIAVTTSTCGSTWLSVSQATGTTAGATPVPVTVSVNPSGITAPNLCTGTLSITSSAAPNGLSVPVVLQVSSTPIIQASPAAINIGGQIGTGVTAAVNLALSSSDTTTPLTWTISSPATWLSVSPTTGSTPLNLPIQVNTSDPNLKIGINTTTLTLTSPSLQQALTIPVTVTLTANANLILSPASLTFTQPSGGTAPAAQVVNLTLSGTGLTGATFTAVGSTQFGSWLTVSPGSGAVPGQISVTVNGANLSQGTYNGSIVVIVAGVGSSPQTIPVTLTITAPQSLAVAPTTLSFATQVGATSAPANQTFQVTSTGGAVAFSVGTTATTCPGFLSATPTTATTPATVTVSINTAGLAAGTCSGSVNISANGLTTQSVAVTLTVSSAPVPQITTIKNGASFVPGSIAPGEIVTVFGANLGPTPLVSGVASGNMFPTKVGDTEVMFDGVLAPVIFAANDQVAVVVPFEVAGRFQTAIQVRRANQLSNTLQQRVVDAAPGIFTLPSGGSGQGAIVNQNGVVNGIGAPAAKGSVVSLYITGAGQTSPGGVTGALNGVNPLNRIIAPVTVTIGGQPARVEYAGGAPFNIQGLYQLNVTLPALTGLNPYSVVITVDGVPTQGSVVMYVQ